MMLMSHNPAYNWKYYMAKNKLINLLFTSPSILFLETDGNSPHPCACIRFKIKIKVNKISFPQVMSDFKHVL